MDPNRCFDKKCYSERQCIRKMYSRNRATKAHVWQQKESYKVVQYVYTACHLVYV